MSKGKDSPVIGVAWYTRENWIHLREVAADQEKLDDSYEEWLAGAEKAFQELADAGTVPVRIDVDIEALVHWCETQDRPIDGAARSHYVADQIRLRSHGQDT